MSLSIEIDGAAVDLGVPPSSIVAATAASMGEVAYGNLTVEDDAAALTIVGHKSASVGETACSQPVLFKGWIGPRGYQRDAENAEITAAARTHDVTLLGLSACFGFRMIKGTDGNRPEETWNARLAWILASNYLAGTSGALVADTGYIMSSVLLMDAADYRGAYPSAVMDDLCDRFGGSVNYYAFWDPAAGAASLYIGPIDDGWSDSTLRISNVLSDRDGVTTFEPSADSKLSREPDNVFSEVVVNYANGKVFRTRPSTATTYIRRGTQIDRPYIGKSATALEAADMFLDRHEVELDRISTTINVPPAAAGLVVAGQRIQVRFSHMPGYESFVWMRVVSCAVGPIDDTCTRYAIRLELLGASTTSASCPTSLGAAVVTELSDQPYAAGAVAVSITPTAGSDSVIIAVFNATNRNVPADADMIASSPSVDIFHGDIFIARVSSASMYRAISAASGSYDATGTYTGGFAAATDSFWAGCAIAFETGATAPVQSAGDISGIFTASVTLPSAPTVGNLLIAAFGVTNGSPPVVTTWPGWTLLATSTSFSFGTTFGRVGIYGRCVEPGDGVTWELPDLIAVVMSVSEWEITPSSSSGTIPTVRNVTAATNPTVNDDDAAGYAVGSTWINTTTGAVFVLADSTTGAAVWTGSAPTGADYLVGTAQSALSAEIVVGTTPGGELGGSWASPTVDATHSGSAHHSAVTLAASADVLLGLSGQALSLDTQIANMVLAGPTTGAAAPPAFRALVLADIPPGVGGNELLIADGTSGPAGITPTSYVEMTTARTTTSATLEDITGATTTITLARTSEIAVWMNCHVSADGTCDMGLAISLDAVDHDETTIHMTSTNEANQGIVHRSSTPFAPGTYTVKGRFRRVSGGPKIPGVDRADLLVMAMGQSGPVILTTDGEDDYLYSDM